MGSTAISVIIPHYVKNQDEDLFRCILSINACIDKDCEVIVVVNGGNPTDSLKQFLSTFDYVKTLYYGNTTSYQARTLGISIANGYILVFIDSDVEVTSDFFKELRNDFINPDTMLSGGKVRFTGEDKVSFITANLAVRSSVFEKVSFNSTLYSGGDLDFARRAISAGMRAEYSYNRTVVHKHEGYMMRLAKSLRYGSGTTLYKMRHSWANHFKELGMLFAKLIGFLYFRLTKKPIGKL